MIDTGEIGLRAPAWGRGRHGLDIGKDEHHATRWRSDGKTVVDNSLPNSEPKFRAMLEKLTEKYGRALVLVDQTASIGALPLTMRRIADLCPGDGKITDTCDAAVIADAARTMPHTHPLDGAGRRDHRKSQHERRVRRHSRGRGDPHRQPAAGPAHADPPSLERVLGPRTQHPAERLVEDIFSALDEHTVIVPGTDAAAVVCANSPRTFLSCPTSAESSPPGSRICWSPTVFPIPCSAVAPSSSHTRPPNP